MRCRHSSSWPVPPAPPVAVTAAVLSAPPFAVPVPGGVHDIGLSAAASGVSPKTMATVGDDVLVVKWLLAAWLT